MSRDGLLQKVLGQAVTFMHQALATDSQSLLLQTGNELVANGAFEVSATR